MRLSRSTFALAALLAGTSVAASTAFAAPAAAPAATAPAATAPAPAAANPDMLIATVNGSKITLGDVQRAAGNLPPQARQIQPSVLVPLIVNQLVDQKAVQIVADKEGLSRKPDVKAAMDAAAANALQNAYLEEKVSPLVTDSALHDFYQSHYANKKPEEEVHARHILVDSEAQAKDIIAQLGKGADFGKLAAQLSKDKGSAGANGGDLGWFKKADMLPAFSAAAFAMKPNTISQTPVHTQYGWHVIQVLATRTAPIPTFDQVHDQVRQELIRDKVRDIVQAAEAQVKVVHYDAQGKVIPNAAPAAAAPAKK
ncbi:peptidylprolyl isomerase [Gluconobacter kanchanaburiensis]|uniref:Parvulin-like PPIase n=1 Tax=Gluconobacter kanchanaburiensis NBRC 103587 TaxID=1307948 RepID=A0A511B378_9PROT|nr:peptidylprolyl isomerase [Gluconobacter kanchanaburiensis]GBR70092.1 peptidyl-prolyl cis-trans isomerase [Gluconobacter kanchanaburiensis NBRC 103587]GEK94876.1 peptidylprolyl isomerase [Gluconobacter kanchanaburiensis NBRC 103587]